MTSLSVRAGEVDGAPAIQFMLPGKEMFFLVYGESGWSLEMPFANIGGVTINDLLIIEKAVHSVSFIEPTKAEVLKHQLESCIVFMQAIEDFCPTNVEEVDEWLLAMTENETIEKSERH